MTPDFLSHFSKSCAEAQDKFVAACDRAGAYREAAANPHTAPHGGKLATEIAWLGPRNAERVLVMQSGTHGVEGLCGAGCQTGWLNSGGPANLPKGVGVLLIHLINPFGVAWTQQETEEGVNLNRNFVDFSKPLPKAPLHAEIHDALMCPDIQGPRYDAAQAVIAAFRARNGQVGYQKAIFGGQYEHPKGINFGGNEPTWSNRIFLQVLLKFASRAREVVFLDYHTGLGPYGHATLITFCPPGAELFRRASAQFGPTVMAVQGDESAAIAGHTGSAAIAALPDAVVTPVTVEYGTYDIERELSAVVRDLWLRNFGSRESGIGAAIKAELSEYFYPDAANWKEMIFCRSQQIVRDALTALSD